MDVDTTNRFLIGVRASDSLVGPLFSIDWPLNEEDALNLAAWLVVLAGGKEKFLEVLDAIESI